MKRIFSVLLATMMLSSMLNNDAAFTYASSIAQNISSLEANMQKVVDTIMKIEQ